MKRRVWIIALVSVTVSGAAIAETCLTNDGFVVECPESTKVQSHFGQLPTTANQPFDIYITGGGTIQGASGFQIRANKQVLCDTGYDGPLSSGTPVRHCVGVIPSPGTYTFDAIPYGSGNFGAPSPSTVVVQ